MFRVLVHLGGFIEGYVCVERAERQRQRQRGVQWLRLLPISHQVSRSVVTQQPGDPEDRGKKNCPHYRHRDGDGNTEFPSRNSVLDFGNFSVLARNFSQPAKLEIYGPAH